MHIYMLLQKLLYSFFFYCTVKQNIIIKSKDPCPNENRFYIANTVVRTIYYCTIGCKNQFSFTFYEVKLDICMEN